MDNDPRELLELAADIAVQAGELLAERQPQVRSFVGAKSSPTDMVTEVDTASERMIVDLILAIRPFDAILGEEGTAHAGRSGVRWVVDPLDGTTNFLYGFPMYAVSIAVEDNGETVAGAVFNAATNELFSAGKGLGATLNGEPIRVSAETDLSRALVGTGFGYDASVRKDQAELLARLIGRVRDIRRAGSAALDLCHVACGRMDAYYEQGLNTWDWAAGELIVREAGGRAAFLAEPPFAARPCIVAANPALFERVKAAVLAAARG